MSIIWAKNEVAGLTATIYDSNITLNKAASSCLEDFRYVLLGYDKDKKQIIIKPVTKEEHELEIYPKHQIHKYSLGKSYGRISNKTFLKEISETYQIPLTSNNGTKYDVRYDDQKRIIIIQL